MARILMVDDDPDQLEVRALVLETENHVVASARNARQALETFSRWAPDIILLDLRLPSASDGLGLIAELRRLSDSVPILVLSGWPDDLKDLPEHPRVDQVLPKPVRSQHLLALIQRLTA
jgi:CheY-like chemotaxis protein